MNQQASNKIEINIKPKSEEFIVSLDIGTTKIVMIAGQKNEYDKFEIIGYGKAPSPSGAIRNGQVLNVEETAKSIREVLRMTMQSNPEMENISEVYAGIAGEHVKCFQTRGDLVRQGNALEDTIKQEEVDQLIENQYKSFVPTSDEIMHVYPLNFFVDNHTDIQNPVGMYGNKLGGNFNLISADKTAINQIKRSIEKAGLNMKGIFLQPIASAQAVMCKQDFEGNVAILDIGGGTSDLAIYQEGKIIHTVVIPMGGEIITQDIHKGLGILRAQAEALKLRFGAAMMMEDSKASKYLITIPGYRGLAGKEIDPTLLCLIIQARVEEILDFVSMHLKAVGLEGKDLNGGLIITGGGALLKNIKQFAEFKTGAEVRIGEPNEHLAANQSDILKSPSLSTSIGILIKGFYKAQDKRDKKEPPMDEKATDTVIIDVKKEDEKKKIKNNQRKDIFSKITETIVNPIVKVTGNLFEDKNDTKF